MLLVSKLRVLVVWPEAGTYLAPHICRTGEPQNHFYLKIVHHLQSYIVVAVEALRMSSTKKDSVRRSILHKLLVRLFLEGYTLSIWDRQSKRFGDANCVWAHIFPLQKDKGGWGREAALGSSHVQRDPFSPCWEQLELTLASTVLGSSNSGSTVKSLHSKVLFPFFGAATRLYSAVPACFFLAAAALLKSILLLESCLARS